MPVFPTSSFTTCCHELYVLATFKRLFLKFMVHFLASIPSQVLFTLPGMCLSPRVLGLQRHSANKQLHEAFPDECRGKFTSSPLPAPLCYSVVIASIIDTYLEIVLLSPDCDFETKQRLTNVLEAHLSSHPNPSF